jgi:CRP/FNR family transcriptional regulator
MRIEYLGYGRAEEKIISTLLFLARHFGEQKNNEVQIQYLFTHKDIASFAGVSRETASRELEKLLKRKLIAYKKHLITIKDIHLLEAQGAM